MQRPSVTSTDLNYLIRLKARASNWRINPRLARKAWISGGYRSPFRGRGMEFDESRIYTPGDDIRTIDWRLTARMNEPYTKVFREERERPAYLLVDLSASLFFATRGALKSVLVCESAALLAWHALSQGDRVGALVFNGEQHVELRAGNNSNATVMQLLKTLHAFHQSIPEEAASESLAEAARRALHVTRPGGMVYLLSDFYHLNRDAEQHIARLARHNDVFPIWFADPSELAPLPRGNYPVTDGRLFSWLFSSGREDARSWQAAHRDNVSRRLGRAGIKPFLLNTTDNPADVLRMALAGIPPPAKLTA